MEPALENYEMMNNRGRCREKIEFKYDPATNVAVFPKPGFGHFLMMLAFHGISTWRVLDGDGEGFVFLIKIRPSDLKDKTWSLRWLRVDNPLYPEVHELRAYTKTTSPQKGAERCYAADFAMNIGGRYWDEAKSALEGRARHVIVAHLERVFLTGFANMGALLHCFNFPEPVAEDDDPDGLPVVYRRLTFMDRSEVVITPDGFVRNWIPPGGTREERKTLKTAESGPMRGYAMVSTVMH